MAGMDAIMFSKRQVSFIMSLVYLLLTLTALAFIYFIVPRILIWLLPFFVAYFFSAIARPLSEIFSKYLKIPIKAARFISIILVFLILGGLIAILIFKLISELSMVATHTPKYVEMAKNTIDNLPLILKDFYASLPDGSIKYVDNFVNSISSDFQGIQQFASSAVSGLGIFITNIPSTIIFIFFTLISSFFLTIDRELIRDTIKSILPKRVYIAIIEAKKNFKMAVWGYFRAQMILFVIVTIELLIGLSLLQVNYVIILAILIAFVDAIPVFGVGTVLIPWAVISVLFKDYKMGISLLALYAFMFIVRQIIEPKIVSTQIGLHPLLTLLSMYAGLKTFGFFGMVLAPITLIIILNLYKTGTFSQKKFDN